MAELVFNDLCLASFDCISEVKERGLCNKCNKRRKYFCYDCFEVTIPEAEQIPSVQLPVELVV